MHDGFPTGLVHCVPTRLCAAGPARIPLLREATPRSRRRCDMEAIRCESCGGFDSTSTQRAEGLCQRCSYFLRRLQLGARAEVLLAAMIRRHPHDAARIRRLRHWMMRREASEV